MVLFESVDSGRGILTVRFNNEQIAKRAMLKKVDVQKYLKDMSTEGLVSSIELARSADRAASRAIYLWYASSLVVPQFS